MRSLLRWMTEDAERQIAALAPSDPTSLAKFREVIGGGVDVLLGRGLTPHDDLEFEPGTELDQGDYVETVALLRNKPQQEELPVVLLHPKNWNKRVVIWVDPAGKAGLYDAEGNLKQPVRALLAAGSAVASADLLYQGEFLTGGKPLTATRRVKNPREFLGYTAGYNPALFAQRVHDVLSLVSFCRRYGDESPQISLIGFGEAGAWAAAARAQAGTAVARAAIDTSGFRFAALRSTSDVNVLPGGAKYGDLPGILSLGAPGETWLAGEGQSAPTLVGAAYAAAGAKEKLTLFDGPADQKLAAATAWLSRP